MKLKSITIHNLEPELEQSLIAEAKRRGLSLNKTVKKLLKESLGEDGRYKRRRKIFSKYFGVWTKEEFDEFEKNTKDDERIFKEDWK